MTTKGGSALSSVDQHSLILLLTLRYDAPCVSGLSGRGMEELPNWTGSPGGRVRLEVGWPRMQRWLLLGHGGERERTWERVRVCVRPRQVVTTYSLQACPSA